MMNDQERNKSVKQTQKEFDMSHPSYYMYAGKGGDHGEVVGNIEPLTYKKVDNASWVRIYIAGNIEKAENICGQYCSDVGLCVTVTPTTYVYKYGMETGVVVELINYPRFPESVDELLAHAKQIGDRLMYGMNQGSYTINTPNNAYWYSRRESDR